MPRSHMHQPIRYTIRSWDGYSRSEFGSKLLKQLHKLNQDRTKAEQKRFYFEVDLTNLPEYIKDGLRASADIKILDTSVKISHFAFMDFLHFWSNCYLDSQAEQTYQDFCHEIDNKFESLLLASKLN